MTGTEDAITAINRGFYSASRDSWRLFEAYYLGQHPKTMLSVAQKGNTKLQRFWAPVNICNVIVNEVVGYLTTAEIKVRVPGQGGRRDGAELLDVPGTGPALTFDTPPLERPDTDLPPPPPRADATATADAIEQGGGAESEAVQNAIGKPDLGKGGGTTSPLAEWAVGFLKKRIKPKLAPLLVSLGVFGEGYVYAYVDNEGLNRGIKFRALAPVEEGADRVYVELSSDEEEVVAATLMWRETSTLSERIMSRRVTLTAARIMQESRGTTPSGYEQNWVRDFNDPNSYGVVPLVRFVNPTPSDLMQIIPLQDDLNKSAYDIRLTREFHGFPMLSSANPQELASVEVSPGKVLQGGPWSRIEAGDLSQILAADADLLGRIALLSGSLLLQEKGGEAPSGLALSYLQQSFRFKVRAKADALEAGYTQLLLIVARMLYASEGLYEIERPTDAAGNPIPREAFRDPQFLVEVVPAEVADKAAQMQADLAAVAAGAMSIEEFGRRNGIDPYVSVKEVEGNLARKVAIEAKAQAQAQPPQDAAQPDAAPQRTPAAGPARSEATRGTSPGRIQS